MIASVQRRAGWRISPLLAAVLVSFLMSAFLGYLIERRASTLRHGTEVLLKTLPVDPRDLLRGDYVILTYDISQIPAALVVGPRPEAGADVRLWVRLKPGPDRLWTATEAAFAELPGAEGSVVIRSQPFLYTHADGADYPFIVRYGIERFYVPEGEGLAIESARDDAEVTIAARVSSAGEAQIARLLVNGEPVYDEPLY